MKNFHHQIKENNEHFKRRMAENNQHFLQNIKKKSAPPNENQIQNAKIIIMMILFYPIGFYMMLKSRWSRRAKLFNATGASILISIVTLAVIFTPPSVTLSSSLASTASGNYNLTAKVNPADSLVTINGVKAKNNNGIFSASIQLHEGDNNLELDAKSSHKITRQTYKIHRFTKKELAQQAKEKKQSEQAIARKNVEDAAKAREVKVAKEQKLAAYQAAGIGKRTKTSGCIVTNHEPDKACSPGAIFTSANMDQICVSGYTAKVRDVSTSLKNAVYAEYTITSHTSGEYEVDHIIPLELGGSNDIANLFPEPANPTPGFHQKDQLENALHSRMCSAAITLADAQKQIANDWLGSYYNIFGHPTTTSTPPSSTVTTTHTTTHVPTTTQSSSDGVVKMSTSGICHAPGTTYYARTTNYTPYQSINACLAAGGRLPLR